jgi:hypothetical protein
LGSASPYILYKILTGDFDVTAIKKFHTTGQEGCDDCQWLANETDGEWLCCDECDWVLNGEDDGQPDWAQEWHDFDPEC